MIYNYHVHKQIETADDVVMALTQAQGPTQFDRFIKAGFHEARTRLERDIRRKQITTDRLHNGVVVVLTRRLGGIPVFLMYTFQLVTDTDAERLFAVSVTLTNTFNPGEKPA